MELSGVDKLTSVAGEALARTPLGDARLFAGAVRCLEPMLSLKNGFYAFESALHVFPVAGTGLPGRSLQEWNDPHLWINYYGELIPGAVFFAEDIFGGQFAVTCEGIHSFNPETAKMVKVADTVEGWCSHILGRYNLTTGYSIAHAWQAENGKIPVGCRLVPRVPFCCGGDFSKENMVLVESVAAMRYWGEFSRRIAELPDGAQFRFNPAAIDALRCSGAPYKE
jgi:hypothetical protein